MRVVNTNAVSYQSKTPEKCLETAKRKNTRKYLNTCLNKNIRFTPFIASMDGISQVEGEATLKRTVSRFAKKWQEPHSRTCGYVKSRVDINLVRSTHRCIRGGQGVRVPNKHEPSSVAIRRRPPPVLIRRGGRPILFHIPPPPLSSPHPERANQSARHQGPHLRPASYSATVCPCHTGGELLPPPLPGTYIDNKSSQITPLYISKKWRYW